MPQKVSFQAPGTAKMCANVLTGDGKSYKEESGAEDIRK